MPKITKFESDHSEPTDDSGSSDFDGSDNAEDIEQDALEIEEDHLSDFDNLNEKLPVLRSIVSKGKIDVDDDDYQASNPRNEDEERQAIKEELSSLSFEELQKLKEKIGSKKFNQTIAGSSKERKPKTEFKRANPNRPRELSSKSRRIETKVAVQVPKVFRNDPRFDNLCGEFHEKVTTVTTLVILPQF